MENLGFIIPCDTIHHDRFNYGVRVLMLINRGVGNSNKGSKRWINKIITTNEEEFMFAYKKLSYQQACVGNPDIRLYTCVNSRDLDKAISMFKHKQIDISDDKMKLKFYSKINSSFCSCLMKPENRYEKRFLLDYDSKNLGELCKFLVNNRIDTYFYYETVNGFHYVVKPFNVLLANECENLTVVKDGLILLNWFDKKSINND